MLRSRALRALVVTVAALALATCGREPAAPHQSASLAIAASLPPGMNLQAFSLSVDHVRLIAVNSAGDTVFNQAFTFAANQTSLTISADVPLAQSPETFDVTIELLSGTTLLFAGTQTLSLTSGSNNPTAQIPVVYSGPGQNVASLLLGPLDSLLTQGASLQFRVSAKDGTGAAVPSFYVSWTTSDTVTAPIDATGTVKAPLLRKTITVTAKTPNAITASTTLQFIAAAASVVFDSGCTQSALPGVQLPQPIVARVLGTDGLGVQGVQVSFAAPSGGSVATPSSLTDTGGRARTLVTLPSATGPAQFQASVTGLAAAVCAPTVLSTPPTQLAFLTQPAAAVAGAAIGSFQVDVRDASGSRVTGATNAVTVAIGTNPGGATLTGTKTVNAVGGVATFTGLSLDKAATGYTLVASASGLTSATSNAFNITAGVVNALVFTTQPVNLVAGTSMPSVVVKAEDALGNTVTTFSGVVNLALGSHPVADTAAFSASADAAAGVATFPGLRFIVAGGYTLVASATGVASTASNTFTVSPAPPVTLAFTVQPTTPLAGAIITPAVVVAVEDSVGNVVTSATNPVTIAFGTNPLGGQSILSGTLTRPAASGVATFNDLTVSTPASGYTLAASSSGLASATSVAFNVLVRPPGVVWTHLQGSGNWSDPANWSPARVPGPTDTASIILPGVYAVTLDVNAHVAFLAVGDTIGGVSMNVPIGRSILIDSSAVILKAGVVVLAGSDTIGGAGNLTNQGSLSMAGSAITTAAFSNTGVLLAPGTNSITGSFSNSGGVFVNGSSSGDAALTFATGFLNAGVITLENTDATARNVTLTVTSGTLTNILSVGTLQSLAGGGGNRTLAAALNNQGGVLVQQTLTIDRDSASYSNTGQIVLSGGDLDVVLSGFRPGFSNGSPGVIDVGTNKLVITNLSTGTFINQAGGTLQGAGTIDIGTSSFITNGTVTVGEVGPGILTFTGPYTQGPAPSIMSVFLSTPTTPGSGFSQFQVSDTVNLQGGTLNATFSGAYAAGSYPVITVPAGKIIMGNFAAQTLPLNPNTGGACIGSNQGAVYIITCP